LFKITAVVELHCRCQHPAYHVMVAVIEPMTSNARLKLNMKPEQSGYIMPKVLVDVVFKEILVALAKSQV